MLVKRPASPSSTSPNLTLPYKVTVACEYFYIICMFRVSCLVWERFKKFSIKIHFKFVKIFFSELSRSCPLVKLIIQAKFIPAFQNSSTFQGFYEFLRGSTVERATDLVVSDPCCWALAVVPAVRWSHCPCLAAFSRRDHVDLPGPHILSGPWKVDSASSDCERAHRAENVEIAGTMDVSAAMVEGMSSTIDQSISLHSSSLKKENLRGRILEPLARLASPRLLVIDPVDSVPVQSSKITQNKHRKHLKVTQLTCAIPFTP